MGTTNQGWYARNATRSYPVDDLSSGVDDSGAYLPPDVLVDANLRYPSWAGPRVYLSAVSVTPRQASLLFSFASRPGTLACVVTLPQPVTAGVQYPVSAVTPGVGGWVVFGDGVRRSHSGRFTDPARSLVSARVASTYRDHPVSGVAKLGAATYLDGVVLLKAGNDVTVGLEAVTLPIGASGSPAQAAAVVFRLKASSPASGNVLQTYAGTCNSRPESGTCLKTPLQAVNGVGPDCAGDLRLNFQGMTVTPRAAGGQYVDLALGVSASCFDPTTPDPQARPADNCVSVIPSVDACTPPPAPDGNCNCLRNTGGGATVAFRDQFGTGTMTDHGAYWSITRTLPAHSSWKCAAGAGTSEVALTYVLTCTAGVARLMRQYAHCQVGASIDESDVPLPSGGTTFSLVFHFAASIPPLSASAITVSGACVAPVMGTAPVVRAAPRATPHESASAAPASTSARYEDDFSGFADHAGSWRAVSGSWSSGVENVPTSPFDAGGRARVVKVGRDGLLAYETGEPDADARRVEAVVSGDGGLLLGYEDGAAYHTAGVAGGRLVVARHDAGVTTEVASAPAAPGAWYVVTASVMKSAKGGVCVVAAYAPAGVPASLSVDLSLPTRGYGLFASGVASFTRFAMTEVTGA